MTLQLCFSTNSNHSKWRRTSKCRPHKRGAAVLVSSESVADQHTDVLFPAERDMQSTTHSKWHQGTGHWNTNCTICTHINITISSKYQHLSCFCAQQESTEDFGDFHSPDGYSQSPHQACVQYLKHGARLEPEKRSEWPNWTVPPRSSTVFGIVHANLAFPLYEMLCTTGNFGHRVVAKKRSWGHRKGTLNVQSWRTEAETIMFKKECKTQVQSTFVSLGVTSDCEDGKCSQSVKPSHFS